MPMQIGDIQKTWADTTLLKNLTGFTPKTEIGEGVSKFIEWYCNYYSIKK